MIEHAAFAEQILSKTFMTKSLPLVDHKSKEIFKLKMTVQLMKSREEFIELALLKEKEEREESKLLTHHSIMSMTSEQFECDEERKMEGLIDISRALKSDPVKKNKANNNSQLLERSPQAEKDIAR